MTQEMQENLSAEGVGSEVTEANTPVVIQVQNPTKEEMVALREHISKNTEYSVDVREATFNFKKSVDKATGIETIRKPVDLAVPYVNMQGIMDILEAGGKGLELLLEAMEGIINTQARELLYEDTSYTAATFPVEKLSWEFISNIPKVQRRGGGIPKEVWDAFTTDYVAVMPEVTGKTLEAVTNMANILGDKLSRVRTSKDVLNLCVEQLAIYAEHSPNVGEYVSCVEFLLNKAELHLNVTPEQLLASL
jgi:hypothetical protein